MKAERARLGRLQRLEKLRAIARQTALTVAGQAEARLQTLENLGLRTTSLIDSYATRIDAQCGADLVGQQVYVRELQRMAHHTQVDIAQARDMADLRAAEAAAAERRRAAVEERATATRQRIARHETAGAVPLGARTPRP